MSTGVVPIVIAQNSPSAVQAIRSTYTLDSLTMYVYTHTHHCSATKLWRNRKKKDSGLPVELAHEAQGGPTGFIIRHSALLNWASVYICTSRTTPRSFVGQHGGTFLPYAPSRLRCVPCAHTNTAISQNTRNRQASDVTLCPQTHAHQTLAYLSLGLIIKWCVLERQRFSFRASKTLTSLIKPWS